MSNKECSVETIPRIILLQSSNLPAEAKPGMLLNTTTKELFNSIEIIPAYIQGCGFGLAKSYRMYGLLVRGDEIVTPCVISFSQSKIKVVRHFMRVLHQANGYPPLSAYRLCISGVPEQNKLGSFFNFRIEPAISEWRLMETENLIGSEENREWCANIDVADTLLPPDHALITAAGKLRELVMS